MNSEAYANDYETILDEITKESIFNELKPLKICKKETLTKKNIKNIKNKLKKYLPKHNKFIREQRDLGISIYRTEYRIKCNTDEYSVKSMTTKEYKRLDKIYNNDLMELNNKYDVNEKKIKYTIKLIKYLLVCVKFNIRINETITKCLKSMKFSELHYRLFNKVDNDYIYTESASETESETSYSSATSSNLLFHEGRSVIWR